MNTNRLLRNRGLPATRKWHSIFALVTLAIAGAVNAQSIQSLAIHNSSIFSAGSSWTIEAATTRSAISRMAAGTVIPFKLNDHLSSNNSTNGDKFEATLDTSGSGYQGLPAGTRLQGHVNVVHPKTGNTPGVLGLAFERIITPDGRTYAISGALIGLDNKSVSYKNGRYTAKAGAKKETLKYVGIGAGAGVILAVLTKGNVVTDTVIGGALGYLYSELQKNPSKARDVNLNEGSKFGVRLTKALSVQTSSSARG